MIDYEIKILGHKLKFVNRNQEIENLKKWIKTGSPTAEFIYGPEGCGKSTLLRYLTIMLKDDYTIMYIDALEQHPSKVLNGIKLPEEEITEIAASIGGPIGIAITKAILKLLERISIDRKFRDKHLAIFVDDPIRAIGTNKCEAYVKWLYELIYKISQEFEPKTTLILTTSSEGMSRRLLLRHNYVHITLIWNLPYEGLLELVQQLPEPRPNIDRVWTLTGGNPRAVINLALRYKWRIDEWLKELKHRFLETIKDIKHRRLENILLRIIEDPDTPWYDSSKEAKEVLNILEKQNMMIYKHHITLTGQEIYEHQEIGIGKYYAWQIPAYREVLKKLLESI